MPDDPGSLARWRDAGADPTKPSIARVYDYWLGGTHNLVADRELAHRMETLDPRIPASCRASRAFLSRAVRFLAAEAGIRQFLDIGSGIPTAGNVHEIAQQVAPEARVVYVDADPVAVAEGRALLVNNPRVTVIRADLRDPAAILADAETARLIDFSEPVGLILVAVLHFLTDASSPRRVVRQLADAMVPGSCLALSHVSSEDNQRLADATTRLYTERAADGQVRSRAEIEAFFEGWELTDPGLVYAPQWHPQSPEDVPKNPQHFWFLAGVATLPHRHQAGCHPGPVGAQVTDP